VPPGEGSSGTAAAQRVARPAVIFRGQNGYDPNAGRSLPRLPYTPAVWGGASPGTMPSMPPATGARPADSYGVTSVPPRPPAVEAPEGLSTPAAPRRAPAAPPYGAEPVPAPLADTGDPGDPMPASGQPVYPVEGPLWTDPAAEPTRDIDLFPRLVETQTGRLMFGVGVNSDAGLVGSFVLDEQNFDWTRWPRGWEDIRNATAWRGAGQHLRIEAVPGTEVQRYMINFQEPYLLNTDVSLGLSGFYYDRRYFEWDENRLGGRISLGYHFTPYLSGTLSFRGEKITVYNPVVPRGVLPEIDEVVGDNGLYGFGAKLSHDTRDSAFLATEGHLIEVSFEQVIGTFTYARGELDVRQYFLLHQRPDGSGRHVLSLSGRMGVTGSDTPIYDHYYAGGFSTIRGFDFRGASPIKSSIRVGGEFMLLASAEYMFPITADDVLRGVVFCDTGTVETAIDAWEDNYRISPGLGLRITIPAMGPAPIALDFAFPVSANPGDREEVFSFFLGVLR
jgi:outer membrane protein insertion porin family